ncbi:MAG: SCO family protein [Alphaproteobacteria bacterium]
MGPKGRISRKNAIIVAGVAAAFLAGGLYYALTSFEQHDRWTTEGRSGRALVGGPFSLIDQTGATRTDADFRGHLMLIYFGYTHCPDACPLALQTMSDAIDALGEKGATVAPIFITVDPARDTPDHLKSYLENFSPRLTALTGDESAIANVAKAYRIFYAKANDPQKPANSTESGHDDYLVDHSSFIYLMGRDGQYLTHFPGNAPPDQLADGIRKFL